MVVAIAALRARSTRSGQRARVNHHSPGRPALRQMYDREHVESVLKRVGVQQDRRNDVLDEIHFPVDLEALQTFLASLGSHTTA